MQIPTLSLLSLLSSISLIPSSFGSLRPIHCATPPSSSDQVTLKASISGYKGPGVYRITNEKTSTNLALNGTTSGSLVNLQPPSDENSQRWRIAASEVDPTDVVITNNGTGLFLSATIIYGPILAAAEFELKAQWTIESGPWDDTLDTPVYISSAAFPGNVLAHRELLGIPNKLVTLLPLTFPIPTPDQSWLLEYLE